MKDFEIRCDASRLEKNNTLYGKFVLGPFLPGQGTTFGNALRRSLLSELSGLAITAFEVIGVMQEFSTLPGLRESVLDLSLNLKQIVLTGVLPISTPPIGFLKVRGPAIIYAADIQLPAGVYCAAPKQYIGTLASNGVLNLKFLVSVGKGHSTQPYSLYRSLSKVKLQPWKKESAFFSNWGATPIVGGSELHKPEGIEDTRLKNDTTLFDDLNSTGAHTVPKISPDMQSSPSSPIGTLNQEHNSLIPKVYQESELERLPKANDKLTEWNERHAHSMQELDRSRSTNLGAINSVASPTHPTTIRELELKRAKRTGVLNAEILNHTSQAESTNYQVGGALAPKVQDVHLWSELPANDGELGENTNGSIKYVNIQKQTFQRVNPHQVLPIDAVFTPVSQVNFLTQVNDRFETPRENIVLEIWTNGSIHPKRALEEAALSLVQNFDTLLKNIQQASSFHKGLRYSNSFKSFTEKNNVFAHAPKVSAPHVQVDEQAKRTPLVHTLNQENLRKKTPSIVGKFNLDNVPLHQAIYNLDIGNLDLSLETFILLKQAKIKNLTHLLKNFYSKEGKFFVKVEQPFFQHNTIDTTGVGYGIDKKTKGRGLSEEESAINNVDRDKSGPEQTKQRYASSMQVADENFIYIEDAPNICLNEKIIEELSIIFSQLGIN